MATIPFNLLMCLVLGLGFCACARAQLRSGAWPWRSDLLSLVLSFALLSVAPVSAYLYLLYPDWSWMYLVEPQRLPPGTGLAVVVLTMLMVPLGYFLGWLLLRVVGDRGLFGLLGASGMGAILLVFALWRRLTVNVRFDDFHQGLLRPIGQGKLLLALGCTVPIIWAAALLVGRSLWAQGRWLRQQEAMTSSQGAQALRGRRTGGAEAREAAPAPAGASGPAAGPAGPAGRSG